MKKRIWILIIILIAIILVLPIRRVANDGGTVEYSAILYKVIKWNRTRIYEENKTGTEIYFFPKNFHSLDYYDDPRPEAIAFWDSSKMVVANKGSYQWSKEVNGKKLYVIADAVGPIGIEYKDTLIIDQGENVKSDTLIPNIVKTTTYKFEGNEFKQIDVDLEYDETNRELETAYMDKGIYIIQLHLQEGMNDVWHSIKVEIVDKDAVSESLQNETDIQ